MRKIYRKQEPFNTLPLWEAVRERRRRDLPYPAKLLAERFGCEPSVARLVAELAGLKGDE